ncbi:hypothetical protein [Actinosynnema sp. NPDC020468]|uniref:hypothetical protein n=1 Tax=Actinosynnema sp. NPDC020468 TaxID=3154488 RepID=UPI0033DAFC02
MVALWNTAYVGLVESMFAESTSDGSVDFSRLAAGYAVVGQAWRLLAADLAVPLWARHACAVAAEEFERRAHVEFSRVGGGGL